MKRVFTLFAIVAVVLTTAWAVITVYDENMKVGRMWETPAVKPHEAPIPVVEAGIVPFDGGEALLQAAATESESLASPLAMKDPAVIEAGRKGYAVFCAQCHGRYHDGNGTVGQSFELLPGDLRSQKVQSLSDGVLFKEISYGVPGGRQPALATTIEFTDRWRIIAFVKSLGVRGN